MAELSRSEILDNIQKKKEQDKDQPQSPNFQQQLGKPVDKQHTSDHPNANVSVAQHVPTQLLSPTHGSGSPVQSKEDSKDKTIKVANSTTITLIENSNLNGEKEKDNNYPKNYFTLEAKNDKKDDCNKNSITITRTIPKQSPGGQAEKAKAQSKPAKRPLQYLETLAEKAGITFEDKYEAANTLLALDKQNNSFRRPDLKQPKSEPDNHNQGEDFRYRNQKEEDDKLQIQQQIIQQQQQQQQFQHLQQQQQQQQQLQQLQQQQQQQLQQLQHQALQRQHQAIQQHLKNQQDQQELLQKQFQQQQQSQQQQSQQQQQQSQQQQPKTEIQQLSQQQELQQQKFLQVVNNQPVHTQQFNVPGIGEINLSFLASPQNNVNLLFDKNQKSGMSGEIKPQQIVDGQSQVVPQQISMSQHEPSQQHHQTVTVVSSMPSSMASHQVQQQASGIQQQTSMPPLQSLPPNTQHPQQISAEWGHSRVQVIQQPLQNSTYLQQLYNAQGPLLMPGNIALHPGINSQQIQVIAAGKPFQGNQLAPHMLTTQGKQVLQGQAAPFPGYTTIPTIPTTQNQTFVFSPLGVINSQPSILPAHSQPTVSGQQQKTAEMHKVMSGGKVTTKVGAGGAQTVPVQAQCVQVSQPVLGQQPQAQIISPLQTGSQTMQFAPWQISGALPQMWTGGLQAGTLPAGGLLAPNPIFIRGSQPDAPPSMFIQHSPQNNVQHNNATVACATTTTKPRASTDGLSKTPRPLSNILPSGIRPASSVSTQTNANQAQSQAKQRGKPGVRSPAPKQDAANQTNKMQHQIQQPKQQLLVMNTSGQMTQIASVADKQPLSKSIQQQAILQQQAIQQHQQQQLIHQQQTQQMVQHYQQQGMTLGMQQGALPVGSVSQALPMTAMPQTISMVQQIHPLGGMAGASTIVGQLGGNQPQTTLTQVHTIQQQPQALVGNNLVQTSVGMAVQQHALNHSTQMQTPRLTLKATSLLTPLVRLSSTVLHHEVSANNLSSSQLTLQQGTVGLITAPVQGSVLPLQPQTLVAHVKSEDEKNHQIQSTTAVQQVSAQSESTEVSIETTPAPASSHASSSSSVTDAAVSTTTSTGPNTPTESTKPSPSKSESVTTSDSATTSSTTVSTASTPVTSSSRQTSSPAPQVTTTVACSSSSSITTSIGVSISSGSSALFKTSQSTSRHMSQQAVHDKGLPKAMVKPNILTHVIEGYVIQEAGEPFAVNRPLREWSATDKEQDKENKLPSADEPPRKKQMLDNGSSLARISSSNEPSESQSKPEPMAVEPDAPDDEPQPKIPNANSWTVSEVCDFIRNIPGCAGYADEFLMQEVDGEALLLIKPEHLVMALSMKLGPALKIVACIDSLRPETDQPSASEHE